MVIHDAIVLYIIPILYMYIQCHVYVVSNLVAGGQ